jgi:F0F1-type ATP synthase membrane subunit b/b'
VQTLLESFKAVLEKEREAEKILLEAREQAEKIRKSAQEKAEAVYKKTYRETVALAKRKSIEIKEQAKNDAESEAQIFVKRAEKLKKKILASAEQKFSSAVNSVLEEILS